jgi:hypothetical protein
MLNWILSGVRTYDTKNMNIGIFTKMTRGGESLENLTARAERRFQDMAGKRGVEIREKHERKLHESVI